MNSASMAAIAAVLVLPVGAVAQQKADDKEPLPDEIVVVGRSVTTATSTVEVEREILVDTATVLKDIPGADVNMNGPVTGIAQYRGMYGDRVSVDIDHLGVVSGGPNAMDTPLSYVSPMITEQLVVARGISGVALAPEAIGGHISTRLARGDFGDEGFSLAGIVGSRYSDNGGVSTTAGRLTIADPSHRFSVVGELDDGDDIDTPEGEIRTTGLSRERVDISYAYRGDNAEFMLFTGMLDTEDTGTPALPMDIIFIDTVMYGAQFGTLLTDSLSLEARIAYNDVDHVMDNHSLRQPPMPMLYRRNTASGRGSQFGLAAILDRGPTKLQFGIDGIAARHESIITNPNNAAFGVTNFNDISRDLLGAYVEWQTGSRAGDFELGLRANRVRADAGDVGAAGMAGMMAMHVGELAAAFNGADRNLDWNTFDAVFKYRRPLSDKTEWTIEIGSKSRAPSYQELYLWLPLQATGGLADGRTYTGNLDLEEERSRELVIGITSNSGRFGFSPQLFYRDIADYIQGVPSTNMAANMVSTMMSGAPPLQFDNVDARIWGMDAAWSYELTERLLLDGVVSILRGRRDDVSDNLYRLSPYSASVGLKYRAGDWEFKSEIVGYGDQEHVSAYNSEQTTAGYLLANLAFNWQPVPSLRLESRVDNLLDESYQDHVAGINRAGGSDIPVGERLFGAGRTFSVGLIYTF